MAAEALMLELLCYQMHQEYVYYTVETDPMKKAAHARNIEHYKQ